VITSNTSFTGFTDFTAHKKRFFEEHLYHLITYHKNPDDIIYLYAVRSGNSDFVKKIRLLKKFQLLNSSDDDLFQLSRSATNSSPSKCKIPISKRFHFPQNFPIFEKKILVTTIHVLVPATMKSNKSIPRHVRKSVAIIKNQTQGGSVWRKKKFRLLYF